MGALVSGIVLLTLGHDRRLEQLPAAAKSRIRATG
jgi:hypothetical protein